MGIKEIFSMISGILLILMSIGIVIAVLLQSSKSQGLGAINGSSSSYLGQQGKSRTMDAMLSRLTKIMCIIMFVLILVMNLINVYL